jgi:thioredoxin reductase/bacterioferritin-associated ferredoxin
VRARYDLAIVGGGPAGIAAALAASEAGLSVVLLDEAPSAGGQIYRAPRTTAAGAKAGPDAAEGRRLRAQLADSRVEARFGRRVWLVGSGFRIDATGPDGPETVVAERLVAATGAYEHVVPFPGWTRPGVIGLAAATVLLKTEARVPGRTAVVAGAGPLLAAVAAGIIRSGERIAAIVDLASPGEWLRALPALARRPDQLRQGASWALTIARARTPVLFRHTVVEARGRDELDEVVVAPVGPDGRPDLARSRPIAADMLAVGHGLVAGAEITRLLRAEHTIDPARGGILPVCDPWGRTSLAGLYAVGDGASVAGGLPASLAGRLAGLATARDAGRIDPAAFTRASDDTRSELAGALAFGRAVTGLMRRRPGLLDAIPGDTVVCRCEDVTRDEIDAAILAGAREVNQLKHFTRCGMGPCGGRMCGETVADLMALRIGSREAVGWWTARPPLRPVPLAGMVGRFTYADIPVPEPAPL